MSVNPELLEACNVDWLKSKGEFPHVLTVHEEIARFAFQIGWTMGARYGNKEAFEAADKMFKKALGIGPST